MEHERVAVIIPCTALNDYVVECLEGCLGMDHPDFQVVLLPDRGVLLPEHLQRPDVLVVPTGDATIGAKRNAGFRAAPDAAYYALIDSDAYPDRHWLTNGVAAFTADDVWAVGGPSLTPPDECLLRKVVGNAGRSFLVSGDLAFANGVAASRACRSLHSCNLILSRRAVERTGGFHEGLATGEDRDLCHRIRQQGGRILFNSATKVFHHNRYLGSHLFRQRFVHGYSIFSIAGADRDRHNLVLFLPLAGALFAAGGLLLGFAHRAGWIAAASLLSAYLLAAAAEAVRTSGTVREVPLTLMAIVTANSGYVLGSLLGLTGRDLDIKAWYQNYRERGRRAGAQRGC